MSKKINDIEVTVHTDKLVERLGSIAKGVDTLVSMIPEHKQGIAEQIRRDVADQLGETITANRLN